MSYDSTDVVLAIVSRDHVEEVEAWKSVVLPTLFEYDCDAKMLSPPLGNTALYVLYVMSKVDLRYSAGDSEFSRAAAAFIEFIKGLRGFLFPGPVVAFAFGSDVGPPMVTYYRGHEEHGNPKAPFKEVLDMTKVRDAEY